MGLRSFCWASSLLLALGLCLPGGTLVTYHPERGHQTHDASSQCNQVCSAIAAGAVVANTFTVRTRDTVLIKYRPVEEIEDVARHDWRQGHQAPILAEAVYPEGLRNNRREHAEKNAVGEARKTGNETQEVWVLDVEGEQLCNRENETRDDKTPSAAAAKHLDDEVRANA